MKATYPVLKTILTGNEIFHGQNCNSLTILEDQQGDETITGKCYGDDEKQYQKNFLMEI